MIKLVFILSYAKDLVLQGEDGEHKEQNGYTMRSPRAGHARLACEVNRNGGQQQEPAEVIQIVKSGHGRNPLALARGGCQLAISGKIQASRRCIQP